MAATQGIRTKQQLIQQAGEIAFAIQAGLDAIQLAAALGGLYLPPFRRDQNDPPEDHPEQAESLTELQDWADSWEPVLDAYDLANPD